MARPFIWLHIKKSAGQSIRKALGEHYVQTKRRIPTPFIALPPEEWNDNLNNFRVPLGIYDYQRMLFAKKFLYPDFDNRFKFAVVRNPYDRAVSCWRYLMPQWKWSHPAMFRATYSFEYFLEMLPDLWDSRKNRHIATHTAPIWPDITDEDGTLLLDYIARLETLESDYKTICEKLEIPYMPLPHANKGKRPAGYRKHFNRKTRTLVEKLYADDLAFLNYDF